MKKEFLELSKEIRKVKAIKIKKRKNVQNKDVIDDNCHCEDDVDIKGHYEDFIDEEKGEVISIWVEDPESGE